MTKYTQVLVNFWYDPSTNRIHFTSAEPERVQFHSNLRPGTAIERELKQLLRAEDRPAGEES